MSTFFLVLALAVAFTDWLAVAAGRARLEEVAKPLVMVLLIAAAVTSSDLGAATRWLVACGLLFGMVGDVFLLPRVNRFVGGLAAFLVGHVLYLIAFAIEGIDAGPTVLGLLIAAALLPFGATILPAVTGPLRIPVGLYVATIAGMVATAVGTGNVWLGIGAVVFAASDVLLGHDRFVSRRTDRREMVHALYHLGQMGIVLGL